MLFRSMPTVLWIMPYLPNCSRPSILAVITDAARVEPCDIAAPIRDQVAPLAKRPRSESDAQMSLTALVAPVHVLASVGIRSKVLAFAGLRKHCPSLEFRRVRLYRLRARSQS